MTGPLVDAAWLRAAGPDVRLVDATYYLPNEGKDAAALFQAAHIPGAHFFDLDAVVDASSGLPHMLPSPVIFAEAVGAMGIGSESDVVVYDQRGLFSAARLWWMFRVFGHDAVHVLDGGLPAWVAAGGAVEAGPAGPAAKAAFTPRFRPELVRNLDDMKRNLETRSELVLDARAAARFHATVPEPRPGMRGGHIPGAVSLPFTELLRDGRMLAPAELREKFAAAGVGAETKIVTSCGSGVTAAVLTLGLTVAGFDPGALYDGSWSEWGGRADTPVEI